MDSAIGTAVSTEDESGSQGETNTMRARATIPSLSTNLHRFIHPHGSCSAVQHRLAFTRQTL